MPDQHILDVFDRVYAEQTEELAQQKAGYAAYLDTFASAELSTSTSAELSTSEEAHA